MLCNRCGGACWEESNMCFECGYPAGAEWEEPTQEEAQKTTQEAINM